MNLALMEALEERLAGLQDCSSKELNEFEDADLAMYPATEISELDLSIQQCELIANHIIKLMAKCEDESMLYAVRLLAVLAYNILMEPDKFHQYTHRRPFFHKYNHYTEDWLRTNGVTTINLEELSESQHQKQQQQQDQETPTYGRADGLKLKLIYPLASEYERKCSIGVWAFCHLRVFRPNSRRQLQHFIEKIVCLPESLVMRDSYGFYNSYKFPSLDRNVYQIMRNQCIYHKPGELMYVFYRGAIILDRVFNDSDMKYQKRLLMGLVFGGRDSRDEGLLYADLGLWNRAQLAALALRIRMVDLLDDLKWALEDPRWVKYAASSLKFVQILKDFYLKYEAHTRPERNRYHVYARLINHHYFYWLSSKSSQELSHALYRLSYPDDRGSDYGIDTVYREWGELLAAKLLDKYSY